MDYRYQIGQFNWNKDTDSFYADAWNLDCIMPDGSLHPEGLPGLKKPFFIHNPITNGFRRFIFRKEYDILNLDGVLSTSWLFVSEDGIKCDICISM